MEKCSSCSCSFEIAPADFSFLKLISPVFAGSECVIPPPRFCPACRKQQRTAWRNERAIHARSCSLCGKRVISLYSPDKPYPVYCSDCWWSDAWDSRSAGADFDFNKTFAAQFQELQLRVPRLALFNSFSENSEYTNLASRNKNCYLSFATFDSEDVHYSRHVRGKCKQIIDCTSLNAACELCYECIYCESSYNLKFSRYCRGCVDSSFLYDCHNCRSCHRCSSLRNKEYCFENKEYSREEWLKLIPDLRSYSVLEEERRKFAEFLQRAIQPWARFVNCIDCTGDELVSCKNCKESYDLEECEDCAFYEMGTKAKNSRDCHGAGVPAELLYQVHGVFNGYHLISCSFCYYSALLFYCDNCQNSKNCFGCISLNRKENCLLNKQYGKDEYEKLCLRVIEHMKETGEWGQYFPAAASPFGYNETVAMEYFPLLRTEALKKGLKWSDYEPRQPEPAKIIGKEDMPGLPDSIADIEDEAAQWALTCIESGRRFRLTAKELKFYREQGVALPRKCPDQRYAERSRLSNPRTLWERTCAKCGTKLLTSFAPSRPETVCCESCYLKVLY